MTKLATEAQQFYAKCCASILDKYRSKDEYVAIGSDGERYFDIQLAMLVESDVFTPVTDAGGRVFAFTIKGYPQYLFADNASRYQGSSGPPAIFPYLMRRYLETGEPTKIISYQGFRFVYAVQDAALSTESDD